MAGSNITVSYQRDDGSFVALTRDESNSRATVTSGATSTATALFLPPANPFVGGLPPAGFKPRYVNSYFKADPRIKRRFPVGNRAALTVLSQPGATIKAFVNGPFLETQLQDWVVTSIVGEKSPRTVNFTSPDTGYDDGTPQPSNT